MNRRELLKGALAAPVALRCAAGAAPARPRFYSGGIVSNPARIFPREVGPETIFPCRTNSKGCLVIPLSPVVRKR